MQWDTLSESSQEVRTFWTGPQLSYYEILSLKSLLATGARVLVYSYERDLNIPAGVELADASEILSGEVHAFRHANGDKSLALHSDLFRYIALERFGGWYADLDIVCLRDKLPAAKTYFAAMAGNTINSAILKFPAHAAIMRSLVEQAWETLPQASQATTVDARLSVGPGLFKRLIQEQAMDHLVLPRSKAYEIDIGEITAFFDPAKCEETLARLANSDFTHLWNEEWRLLRIPKTFGPPKGSFLDLQFRRFDIQVPERARLEPQAIEAWVREQRLLTGVKTRLGTEAIETSALDQLALSIQTFGWEPRHQIEYHPQAGGRKLAQTSAPQTLRSFWQGDSIGPYQLMCLKSFVDRGHDVEIFTYNLKMLTPAWLRIRDAEEILPESDVLRPLLGDDRIAIHANLFRYELLRQVGGWWIDPDVMLMKPGLPDDEIFFGGRDVFGRVPTSILKFQVGHTLLNNAVAATRAFGDDYVAWERGGADLLTQLVEGESLASSSGTQTLGSVSWFNVLELFDPSKAAALIEKTAEDRFLQLHDEVWRRAGIPPGLAPPQGSLLDVLLTRHEVAMKFPARMDFACVHRWLAHMYRSVQIDRSAVVIA